MKKVLVTGAAGMLGEKIIKYFSSDDYYRVFATFRNEIGYTNEKILWKKIDLNDRSNLLKALNYIDPDIIIHCAANINLDQTELDNTDAKYIHSDIIKEFKQGSPNAIFVYISTDSIFNGKTGNYKESDDADPINKYALSKLDGESNVKKYFRNYIILRTNIYGYHSSSNKPSLAQWAISKLKNHEPINGFDDVIFNPVYTMQLAMIVEQLLKIEFRGLINVACDEIVTKHDFLIAIAKKFNFNEELITKSNSNKQSFIAARPLNTSLNNSLVNKIIGKNLSLSEGMQMLFNDFINKN